MHYLSIFFKKIINPALKFRAFGRKTNVWGIFKIFEDNSREKLIFPIKAKFFLKLASLQIKSDVYNNDFSISRGWDLPVFPLQVPYLT